MPLKTLLMSVSHPPGMLASELPLGAPPDPGPAGRLPHVAYATCLPPLCATWTLLWALGMTPSRATQGSSRRGSGGGPRPDWFCACVAPPRERSWEVGPSPNLRAHGDPGKAGRPCPPRNRGVSGIPHSRLQPEGAGGSEGAAGTSPAPRGPAGSCAHSHPGAWSPPPRAGR